MSSTFILAVIINMFSFGPTDHDNYKLLPNEIVWDNSYHLSWNDFKGVPNFEYRSDALTSSSIYFGYRFDGHRTYEVEVYSSFFRDKSWVKEGSPNRALLEHEQRHFDLTEIYARKLRKELIEYAYNGKSLERNYDRIFDKYFRLLEKEQAEYDHDTHHSLDRNSQRKWDNRIAKELRELEEYSSVYMTIVCNSPQ